MKAIVKDKEVKILATSQPFLINEAHFADAPFFEEYDRERPKSSMANGIPLMELKKYEIILTRHKRTKDEGSVRKCKKNKLDNGQNVYRL